MGAGINLLRLWFIADWVREQRADLNLVKLKKIIFFGKHLYRINDINSNRRCVNSFITQQ